MKKDNSGWSKWYSYNCCISCDHKLNLLEEYDNNGTCPYCGRTSNSTITETIKVTRRHKKIIKKKVPLWKFWEKDEIEYEYEYYKNE